MEEIYKEWLCSMYATEIAEKQKEIRNEHLWELGSDDEEEAAFHTVYIEELKEYIKILQSKRDEIEAM
jgi:hypothetical protein